MSKLNDTIKLFKSLNYEPNKYVVDDAKTDVKNHKKLGNHILHTPLASCNTSSTIRP